MPQRSSWMWSPLAAVFMIAMQQTAMSAEPPRERTLEEIKEESIGRAERGNLPILQSKQSRDEPYKPPAQYSPRAV